MPHRANFFLSVDLFPKASFLHGGKQKVTKVVFRGKNGGKHLGVSVDPIRVFRAYGYTFRESK